MSDQDKQVRDEGGDMTGESTGRMRSIPDGGLGASMPAWLQQPPAWRNEAIQTPTRVLPASDRSVIDPREMLDIDDLPAWLQDVARRGAVDMGVVETRAEPVAGTTPAVPAADVAELAPPEQRSPEPAMDAVIEQKPVTIAGPVKASPWWLSDAIVGGLFIAVVLTIIYVVLVASGVL